MVEGVNSSMIYLIQCKNFYKCHNVPPPDTIKKERKERRKEGRKERRKEGRNEGTKEGGKEGRTILKTSTYTRKCFDLAMPKTVNFSDVPEHGPSSPRCISWARCWCAGSSLHLRQRVPLFKAGAAKGEQSSLNQAVF
jgi:hypothetical protein